MVAWQTARSVLGDDSPLTRNRNAVWVIKPIASVAI